PEAAPPPEPEPVKPVEATTEKARPPIATKADERPGVESAESVSKDDPGEEIAPAPLLIREPARPPEPVVEAPREEATRPAASPAPVSPRAAEPPPPPPPKPPVLPPREIALEVVDP